MAKWGEGDERWRVNDMGEAGKNVNNWHWTEKDALPWAKQRLASLLGDVELAPGMRTTGLSSVEGEAVVNNRKKKIIVAYELDVKLGWAGSVEGQEVSGSLRLPYISEENHDEDPELQVATADDSPASRRAKEAILASGKKVVHDAIAAFVKELRAGGPMREGASQEEQQEPATQPPKQQQQQQNGTAAAKQPAAAEAAKPAKAAGGSKSAGSSSSGHQIRLTEKFYCSASDIYECFTDARRVMAYTQSPAEVQPTPGGRLSMFGGSVQGEFRELQPPNRLVLGWRFSSWEEGCMSQVTIDIQEAEKGSTVVKLTQTGIPDVDAFGNHDVVGVAEAGWKNQVFGRIRMVFGYGVGL